MREQLKKNEGLLPESQGQILALTVVYGPYSLGSVRSPLVVREILIFQSTLVRETLCSYVGGARASAAIGGCQFGTNKTDKARFWPWSHFSGKSL